MGIMGAGKSEGTGDSTSRAYSRHPSLRGDQVVFVSGDCLWQAFARDGHGDALRKLVGPLDGLQSPVISEDGRHIAFTALAGATNEVFLYSTANQDVRQLSFFGCALKLVGWKDRKIIVSSNYGQPFHLRSRLGVLCPETLAFENLPFGDAVFIDVAPDGTRVLSRYELFEQFARKRYLGGCRGDLWIDRDGSGQFEVLIRLDGNLARPHLIGDRVYFLSDHEGSANIYSCARSGLNLTAHTFHTDYYARQLRSDGRNLIFSKSGDIHFFDVEKNMDIRLRLDHAPSTLRRISSHPGHYLQDFDISDGKIAVVARGKGFVRDRNGGGFVQIPLESPSYWKALRWLSPGKTLLGLQAACRPEIPEKFMELDLRREETRALEFPGIGRIRNFLAHSASSRVALEDQRNQLWLGDLADSRVELIEKNDFGPLHGFAFFSDPRWLAYASFDTPEFSTLKIYDSAEKRSLSLCASHWGDSFPCFSSNGHYLFFLSNRCPNPMTGSYGRELVVPRQVQLCVLSVHPDAPLLTSMSPEERKSALTDDAFFSPDFDGARRRVCVLPMPAGDYTGLNCARQKLCFLERDPKKAGRSKLHAFDLVEFYREVLDEVESYALDERASAVLCLGEKKLRLREIDEETSEFLQELPEVEVDLDAEWRGILAEAWHAQKEAFWKEEMGVDWRRSFDLYSPLLSRCSSRSDLSDLIWELQGELASSHAFEAYQNPEKENLAQGYLGASFRKKSNDCYRVDKVFVGDVWDTETSSPFARHGNLVAVGERLWEIDGVEVGTKTPEELLAGKAGVEIRVKVGGPRAEDARELKLRALRTEFPLHYLEWVTQSRARVDQLSRGKIAYQHVPDMYPAGYADFLQYYSSSCLKDALILDLRYNTGGYLSDVILQKLGQRRVGFTSTRWGRPRPYPEQSPPPVLVLLINEFSCSDAEVFAQAFKELGLGPVIGKQSWGGTVGFAGRNFLADGGSTTQPHTAHWMKGVKWNLENFGCKPSIEVENLPQDASAGRDRQLEAAVKVGLDLFETLGDPTGTPHPD